MSSILEPVVEIPPPPLAAQIYRWINSPDSTGRLLLATTLPLFALGAQWSLWSWLQPFVWFLFYPAVFFSARLAGRLGAMVSTALSALIVIYFFIPPQLSWSVASSTSWFSIAVFVTMGWLFGEMNEQLIRILLGERKASHRRDAQLAAIVNSTDDAIISGTLDGQVISWNRGAETLYGYTAEEANTPKLNNIYPPNQRAEFMQLMQRVAQGETITGLETRRFHKDGHEIYISATLFPLRNEHGEVTGASMIAQNITQRKLDQLARKSIENRFESLFNSMQEGFFLAELVFNVQGDPVDWRYLDTNPAFTQILGMKREEVVGRTVFEVFPDMDAQWFAACVRVAVTGEPAHSERFGPNTGRYFINHYYSPQRNRLACIFSDITERKLAENALRESQQRYARVLDGADQGFWEWSLQSAQLTVSPRFESILGYASGEFTADPVNWADYMHPDDYARTKCAVVQNLRTVSPFYESELRCKTKSGSWCWVLLRGKVTTRSTNGRALLMSGTLTDISHRKLAEEMIWQQANYDGLTSLPNRSMLRDRLNQDIKKARHDGSRLAILFIDLDHFKEVNDTQGHDKGDLLLVEAARRIKCCVRESDTVSRQGGDEFTVVLPNASNLERVEQVAQSILTALSQEIDLEGEQAFVSASIGISVYPDDANDTDGLKKCADQALYAAKDAGRNRFSFFTQVLQETAQTRMRLTNDLRNALAGSQLRLVYQPIIDLATGNVRKAEALIRWQHPQRGLISPAEFIPLAESSGLIIEIGEWVFRQAAQQAKVWRTSHHPEFQISVNKSPVQFANSNGPQSNWFEYLDALGLPGRSIVVEITEGLLLAPRADIVTQLSNLRAGGVGVSLDDFGTGYSSLSYLQKFDIDFLKIDQSFVRNLSENSKNMSLCTAIIVMAHELGMRVIAEGIETAEQRDLLVAAGCDYGQGYLFSRPVSPADFEDWLIANSEEAGKTIVLQAQSHALNENHDSLLPALRESASNPPTVWQ
jgi:diguanylate cyclase (GGDEF)-like protein/PAS domain S-box-containing protein